MAKENLNIKVGTISNFQSLTKSANTLYFATDSDKVYIYKGSLNVVPYLLGLTNGGTGATFAGAAANSVVTLNSAANAMQSIKTANGAFYATGANAEPKFGTLPVAQGGTGKTSFTDGGLLIGANGSAIEIVADVAKGSILMSNGTNANPIYGKPSMKWTGGTTAGPVFNYTINGIDIAGTAIPAASSTASGIITTGAQSFNGEKSFGSTLHTFSIYPTDTLRYNLGYYNSLSNNRLWNALYIGRMYSYDINKYKIVEFSSTAGGASATEGTAGTAGYSNLYLGNNIARSTTLNQGAGNSKGRIYLYGSGSGYTLLQSANNTSTNYTINLPPITGNVIISTGEYSSTSTTARRIPYHDTYSYQSVVHSNDFAFIHKNGDTSTTPGVSCLKIGNNINVGTAGNQQGSLRLYTAGTSYVDIIPGTTSTTARTIYLPDLTGQAVVHTNDTQIGSGIKPIYIAASGAATASTSSVANSGKQLMYLNSGTLTASDQTVGAKNKFVYLSGGTLTESDSEIGSGVQPIFVNNGTFEPSSSTVAGGGKQLMYLNNGILTASEATEGAANKPVYLNKGVLTACTPSSVFSNFSRASAGTTSGETIAITVATQYRTLTLDSASASQSGVVTTGTQTFAGSKTFNSVLNAFGGALNIGNSSESVKLEYDASTDTLTMIFAS